MRSVWAVARNTIAQAIRMKVAVVVVVLLVILLPLMSMTVVGDETLHGKLQTFVSYGLSLTTVLLCLLTIAISTFTLTDDIKRRYVFLVVTKPIYRFQIVLGKLLGVIVIDAILLCIFAAVIYGLTLMIPRLVDAEASEIRQAKTEFFTARVSLTDPEDEKETDRLAEGRYKELERKGQLPETMSAIKTLNELKGQEKLKARSIPANGMKKWEFENVFLDDPNDTLFIRYKFDVAVLPPDQKVHGIWEVGDYRQLEVGAGGWKTPIARVLKTDEVRTVAEIEVPAKVVADDGYVGVVLRNPDINRTTVIPEDVQLLYRKGSFTSNFMRVALLIGVRLIFLAALGVSVSTWLSFPVAFLTTIVVFLVGMINGFVVESFDSLGVTTNVIYLFTTRPLLWFLPRLDGEFNPTQFVVFGRLLTWRFLAQAYGVTICVKALVVTLLGMWIFSNREIAKVVV